MIFKHKDLMSSVLPQARARDGWPDGMEPWAAADGECKGSCNDHTDQCNPSCGATGNPCQLTIEDEDKEKPRKTAELGLLQEQLRQTLALGL